MKKIFFAILLLAFLASCDKDPSFIKARFSVLGDSYSAFKGYVDPDSNKVWQSFPKIGVTGPELMWWSLVADETGWTLEKNNSYSASLICNMDHEEYSEHSFIRRMNNLGNPDVYLCSGGVDASIRDAFIESMHVVANHYHVKSIDLNYIVKQKWHPNADGQKSIATQILEALLIDKEYLNH